MSGYLARGGEGLRRSRCRVRWLLRRDWWLAVPARADQRAGSDLSSLGSGAPPARPEPCRAPDWKAGRRRGRRQKSTCPGRLENLLQIIQIALKILLFIGLSPIRLIGP